MKTNYNILINLAIAVFRAPRIGFLRLLQVPSNVRKAELLLWELLQVARVIAEIQSL